MLLPAPPALLLLGTTLTFRAALLLLSRLPLPSNVRGDPVRTWRWHNLLVSFAHSIVSGLWALLCVWQTPEMLVELETASSLSGYWLVCFSTGYFIHDTLDIVLSSQTRASWEYLVHHVLAIFAFASGIFQGTFVAGGVMTLFVEVSNIFLTIRMLMKLSNNQNHVFYEINKYINLAMYFLFRLAPQAYLTSFFLQYLGQRTLGAFLLTILLLLDLMILTYFSRLLRSDFCPDRASLRPNNNKFLID
ncbi:TLC domain-containing protein 1 [Sarcophilus harrisii]|uniref:RAB34, member RAS onco family n=1 Tax=Sarcophilus harrisii TaxID=9305 RepID=A0A7N4P4T3_SARHA|nr:TLC domain-containing protein 1 [Sarcophilus harrisii]XP_031823557.1 TLC domain-containing protein 1 [Sarcophilus harrisii]